MLAVLARQGSSLLASHAAEVELALACGFPARTDRLSAARCPPRSWPPRWLRACGMLHVFRPQDVEAFAPPRRRAAAARVRVSLRLRGRRRSSLSPLAALNAGSGSSAEKRSRPPGAAGTAACCASAGLNLYVGTQQPGLAAFDRALRHACEVARALRPRGIEVEEINLGGGIPSPWLRRLGPLPALGALARPAGGVGRRREARRAALRRASRPSRARVGGRYRAIAAAAGLAPPPALAAEPGRAIVGNAAVLVSTRDGGRDGWLFLDASRNYLGESPLLFGRRILPLRDAGRGGRGASCTSPAAPSTPSTCSTCAAACRRSAPATGSPSATPAPTRSRGRAATPAWLRRSMLGPRRQRCARSAGRRRPATSAARWSSPRRAAGSAVLPWRAGLDRGAPPWSPAPRDSSAGTWSRGLLAAGAPTVALCREPAAARPRSPDPLLVVAPATCATPRPARACSTASTPSSTSPPCATGRARAPEEMAEVNETATLTAGAAGGRGAGVGRFVASRHRAGLRILARCRSTRAPRWSTEDGGSFYAATKARACSGCGRSPPRGAGGDGLPDDRLRSRITRRVPTASPPRAAACCAAASTSRWAAAGRRATWSTSTTWWRRSSPRPAARARWGRSCCVTGEPVSHRATGRLVASMRGRRAPRVSISLPLAARRAPRRGCSIAARGCDPRCGWAGAVETLARQWRSAATGPAACSATGRARSPRASRDTDRLDPAGAAT